MKPPVFDYRAPHSVEEALADLAAFGEDARPIAGGQSLMPMLALRLTAPSALIDLNRIPALAGIANGADGLEIGAMTRTHTLERSPEVARAQPLLAAAIPWIAHYPIRCRGTIGGSLAHADPSAELPAVALALGARFHVAGPDGERIVAAEHFFRSMFETAIASGEILTRIVFPPFKAGRAFAVEEIARRHGDYAMAGVALWFDADEAGCVGFGLTDRPQRLAQVETALRAGERAPERIREAARADLAGLDLNHDFHASAQWRADVAPVIVARAVARAQGGGPAIGRAA